MGTDIRPEVSKDNPYWISRHRYYELKHFVKQFPEWNAAVIATDAFAKHPESISFISDVSDPTAKCAIAREKFMSRINLVKRIAKETDEVNGYYILQSIINNYSYDIAYMKYDLRISKDEYYKLYRKFFWLLSQARN